MGPKVKFSLVLNLQSNNLTGELTQELSNLVFLKGMLLAFNFLSGPVPSFLFNISTLISLDLAYNQFSGSLPSQFSLPDLVELRLQSNTLTGPIPTSMNNASNLAILIMSTNYFTGSIPKFDNLRFLYEFFVAENNLTGAESPSQEMGFLSSLTNSPYLENLELSQNPLNAVLPTSIGNFSSSLLVFHAGTCNIHGVLPSEIGNISSLMDIYLSENQISGFIPATIGNLRQLQRLYLDSNLLQGPIPYDLCKLSYLGELYMQQNMLTGPIPECLGEVKSLKNVLLGSNALNSTVPPGFWDLVDLVELNLSSNCLSGQISSQIEKLKAVSQIDLSFNQFSGDIPSSIDGCQSLEFLHLSNNNFGGAIPQSLGNVRGLTRLDLSRNNLSGLIPNSFQGLKFLQYFNASYNRLEGEIPNDRPFANFDAQSFAHNSALCGATRFQVSPCVKNQGGSRSRSVVLVIKYVVPSFISAIIFAIVIVVIIGRRKRRKASSTHTDGISTSGGACRRVSYAELLRGTSGFNEANFLGRGSFSSVFRATLLDGLNVAVKVFNLQSEGANKSFDTESEILSSIRHRNLVRVIGCCCNAEFKALILAYMPNGNLEQWLYSDSCFLDLLQRLNIAIDVALALEYLHHDHTFPVVHCDIKPSNVLLDEDMTARVCDFGIAKLFEEGETVIQTKTLATIGYVAPEYESEGKVSTKGDVYSYGIMLVEMFTRKKPTDDMFSDEMSLKEWVEENVVSEVVDPDLLAREDQHFFAEEQCISSIFGMAMKCLCFSPEERINMIEMVAAMEKVTATYFANKKSPTVYNHY